MRLFLVLGCVALLAGCAGYRLGPSNGLAAGERSVQINPPVNSTLEPRLGEAVSHAMRKQIQRDGTYRLETRDPGDIIVTTTLVDYRRQGVAFEARDALTARDYVIRVLAQVSAHDRITGKNLFNREFNGRTTVRVGRDQTSSERQAYPLLAEDLARNVVAALADGEW